MKSRNVTVLLASVFVLATFLRFWGLEYNPLWYTDEGNHIWIAWSLLQGEPNFFGMKYQWIPKPPLFYMLLASGLKIFGRDILVLRGLTAGLGVATCGAVYLLGRELKDAKLGLASTFIYAVMPQAILYTRWGFDYVFLGLLIVFGMTCFVKYLKTQNDNFVYLGGVFLILAIFENYYAILFLFAVCIIFTVMRVRRWDMAGLLSMVLLPVFWFWIYLFLANGGVFLTEFYWTFLRISGQGSGFLSNLFNFFTWGPLFAASIIFTLVYAWKVKDKMWRFFATLFTIYLFFTAATAYLAFGGNYASVHLFPFIAVGAGMLLYRLSCIKHWRRQIPYVKVWSKPMIPLLLIVLGILGFNCYQDYVGLSNGFDVGATGKICVQNPDDAKAMAYWLDLHTTSEDLVIVSPAYAFMLTKPKVTDWIKVTYFYPNPFEPPLLDDSRLAYNIHPENAKYVVTDSFSENWVFQHVAPWAVEDILKDRELVFELGEYAVYQ